MLGFLDSAIGLSSSCWIVARRGFGVPGESS
jgi:hypothetical protein